MQPLSTLDTTKPINFDDLNIIIRSLPPQRRQSGTSIIPFRPYVKRLTSVRQPFSFANGRDGWITTGEKVAFFKQENARCIGSLVSDCETSEVIRWDIEGESTRLPMMCKLWMIVDGAVVERGKPRMVQDVAVQVYRAGQTLLSLLAARSRQMDQTVATRYDRRRRHSWHDVNEYHSIPYFQYTSSIRPGPPKFVQCDIDNEQSTSQVQYLPFITEEMVEEQYVPRTERHTALESIHGQHLPSDRVQISITTKTEHASRTRPVSIDSGLDVVSHYSYELIESVYTDSPDGTYHIISGSNDDISYSSRSITHHDDTEYVQHSTVTDRETEYPDESSISEHSVSFPKQSVVAHDDTAFSNQVVSTHHNAEYVEESTSTQGDLTVPKTSVVDDDDAHFSSQVVTTQDDAEYAHQTTPIGNRPDHTEETNFTEHTITVPKKSVVQDDDHLHLTSQTIPTRDHAEKISHSIATGHDIEYVDQSIATHDPVEYAHQAVATADHIKYSNQSSATHDDVQQLHQSVSTRDDIEYADRAMSTYDDVKYCSQAVGTSESVQHASQSVSTRDDIEYSNQCVGTGDGVRYAHQSVATGDDLTVAHQGVSTRDDIESTHRSIGTGNDVAFANQSVSTHDDVQFAHQSVSTHDGVQFAHQSVATHDDVHVAHQSVSTRDDLDHITHQSIATGSETEFMNQSVSTRDDLLYTHRSAATHDDIGYASQSVSTRDDLECLNQSISTRDDFECLNQSVSTHDDIHYSSRSIATGTDYPDFWLQFTTSEVLSEMIVSPSDGRESSIASPRQHDQSIQTETEQDTDVESEKPRPSSSRSSRTAKSSSSTITNHYEVVDQIDEENHVTPSASFGTLRHRLDSPGDLESHFSYNPIETSSTPDTARSDRKASSLGYHSFELAVGQQVVSTPDLDVSLVHDPAPTFDTSLITRTKLPEGTIRSSLESLSERYERTLRDRRRAMAVINDELLDVNDVVERYRQRVREPTITSSTKTTRTTRERASPSPKAREERTLSPASSSGSSRSRYRFVSSTTSDEATPDYLPRSHSFFADSAVEHTRRTDPHICEICFTDHSSGSAWIRYNERRLEQLQQRINLMLEMEDVDDAQLTYSTLNRSTATTQRIDDILRERTRHADVSQMIVPYRRNYLAASRAKSTGAVSSRVSSARKLTRSASPASKRVRISTNHVLISSQTRKHEPIAESKTVPRPIVSILRRNTPALPALPTRSSRYLEAPPLRRSRVARPATSVEEWSIPRYYRLYNDVGFRDAYDFSRMLDASWHRTPLDDYSIILHTYPYAEQFLPPVSSVA